MVVSLLLSIAAVTLGVAAFMATLRDDGDKPGRVLQTRLTNAFTGDPLLFPLDDVFMSRDGDGTMHALYAYPPGFFGHNRGCKVVWVANDVVQSPEGEVGPGLFVDPCGGARFDRTGALVSGQADHALDFFETDAGLDGIIVDTRTLWCGAAYEAPEPRDEPTQTPAPTQTLLPFTGTALALTATFLPATAIPSATEAPPTSTRTLTPTATSEPEKCDRVSPNTKR